MTFGVVPAEDFWEKWNIRKGSPVFLDGMFQMEIWVPFLPNSSWVSKRYSTQQYRLYLSLSLLSLAFLAQFVSLGGR